MFKETPRLGRYNWKLLLLVLILSLIFSAPVTRNAGPDTFW